jgi:hypothetical protein
MRIRAVGARQLSSQLGDGGHPLQLGGGELEDSKVRAKHSLSEEQSQYRILLPVTRRVRDEDEREHERELPKGAEGGDNGALVELSREEAEAEVVADEENL